METMIGYSSEPLLDAHRHLDQLALQQSRQLLAENSMIEDFIAACQRCDANALAAFAPMVPDWDAAKRKPRLAGEPMPKRVQTLAEVIDEATDYPSGPGKTEHTQLLLNLAFGTESRAVLAQQARQLLANAGHTFAIHNAGVEV
jgi:hypothetical protein